MSGCGRPLSYCALYSRLLTGSPTIIYRVLFYPRQVERTKLIQSGLEVIQDNSVGKELENERKFPERIETVRKDRLESVCDRKYIHDREDD